MIKKINAYVVICITTLICFSGCQLTDEENNAPDIRIHINDNYEEESRVACINEEYYYIKDKNLCKHNSDDIIYSSLYILTIFLKYLSFSPFFFNFHFCYWNEME